MKIGKFEIVQPTYKNCKTLFGKYYVFNAEIDSENNTEYLHKDGTIHRFAGTNGWFDNLQEVLTAIEKYYRLVTQETAWGFKEILHFGILTVYQVDDPTSILHNKMFIADSGKHNYLSHDGQMNDHCREGWFESMEEVFSALSKYLETQ